MLAVWGSAALDGRCSVIDASEAVAGDADVVHRVVDVPGETDPVTLPSMLSRLGQSGATGLRLVLPRPGDPSALAGPRQLTEAAVAAGAAVLAPGAGVALVPAGRATWKAYTSLPDARTPLSLRDAERNLTSTIRNAAAHLAQWEGARWDPAAAGLLEASPYLALPPGVTGAAVTLLTTSLRLAAVADIALTGEGGALTRAAVSRRREVLRQLSDAARRGVEAACSSSVRVEARAGG